MFSYQSGFGNEFATEALAGALPPAQNSPQRCPYDLYAEQFSGTAFTAPRHANRRSWLYRIRPAVTHAPFQPLDRDPFADQANPEPLSPNQLRWDPPPLPTRPTDFVEGLLPIAGNGSPETQTGCGIYHVRRQSIDGQSVFLQRRWRAPDSAAARRFDPRYRARAHAGSNRRK